MWSTWHARVLFALTAWVILAGFYLLFAGQLSLSEVFAGVPASLAITAFSVLLHRAHSRRLRLRAPWWRMIGKPLTRLFPDAVKVGGILLRSLRRQPEGAVGIVSRQPFRHGDGAAADAGRRALSTLSSSLAPNGYVLVVPDSQDVLVLHRLAPAGADSNTEWPA